MSFKEVHGLNWDAGRPQFGTQLRNFHPIRWGGLTYLCERPRCRLKLFIELHDTSIARRETSLQFRVILSLQKAVGLLRFSSILDCVRELSLTFFPFITCCCTPDTMSSRTKELRMSLGPVLMRWEVGHALQRISTKTYTRTPACTHEDTWTDLVRV